MPKPPSAARPAFVVVMVAIVLGFAELTAYVAGHVLADIGVFYIPPSMKHYEGYLRNRKELVGWETHPLRQGPSGARQSPSFPNHEDRCVTLFGDSFTFGQEVGKEHTWGEALAKKIDCRASNFGVPGFGSDQATVLHAVEPQNGAAIVVLGHLTENILRNVNQHHGLLYSSRPFGLKPRFILKEGGGLELVPIPDLSKEQHAELLQDPERYLHHEYFRPGGPSGKRRLTFPFTFSLLGALNHYHVKAAIAGVPRHTDFYQADHPAQGLELTVRIFERFIRTARERGEHPLVVIIPTGLDVKSYPELGWVHAPLVRAARERGIDVIDAARLMLEARGGAWPPCELYSRCSGHFNKEGYALLGEVVYEQMKARGLLEIVERVKTSTKSE